VNTPSLSLSLTALSACTLLAFAGWKHASVPEAATQSSELLAGFVTLETPELAPSPSARAALATWVSELAVELVREPYEPRAFQERCEACSFEWTEELQAELESWLANPPAANEDVVALASLGRAQALALSPELAAALHLLAQREDLPFGVALESARAVVAGSGQVELDWWCNALASDLEPRAFSIASGALDAVRDMEAARRVVNHALELGDSLPAGRLLDAIGRALVEVDQPWIYPGSEAASGRLLEVVHDALADAGFRARSLVVLGYLDPNAAQGVASEWMLDPDTGPERIEAAAASLHGCPATLDTLQAAQADARIDEARRVRLAECLLFTPPEQLSAEARAAGLAEMRSTLIESGDPGARRRALHALARFGTEQDRALVQQVADGDADALARTAAKTALAREASEWR